jgi:hypothetical protein
VVFVMIFCGSWDGDVGGVGEDVVGEDVGEETFLAPEDDAEVRSDPEAADAELVFALSKAKMVEVTVP